MHVKTRNVNTAFKEFVEVFAGRSAAYGETPVRRRTRNGRVLMIDEPVTVTYSHPRERVLFNASRDANPFFHMYEALWMLAGKNDVASVAYYAKQMKEYSDDGKTLNGAYGYRWRQAKTPCGWDDSTGPFDFVYHDQIDVLVNHLKADPNSRRAVLQMWNVEDDLLKVGSKCGRCKGFGCYVKPPHVQVPSDCEECQGKGTTFKSNDVCCNLSVMFSLRIGDKWPEAGGQGPPAYFLDITVTNRSNDLVWGMLGANYVHFSFLQEYMAARLAVSVGRYHHFTNNLHVYDWNWKPDEWMTWERNDGPVFEYDQPGAKFVPLVKDPAAFERELPLVVRQFDGATRASVPGRDSPSNYSEPFLRYVVQPALMSFQAYKRKDRDVEALSVAAEWANEIKADDWRVACTEWLLRRAK
ncbi:MAG: thymidylate synthase [Fimbriiglobus sp.]